MRLNHVTLRVSHLDRSVAFYKLLGFTQLVASAGYARFLCPEGESTLSIESRHGPPPSPGEAITVHFESERLDALVDELKQLGVAFEQDPTDQRYLWREAILLDPDGHRLFLFHAGVNRRDPPWRLA